MAVTLNDVKAYLRIDSNAEDALISQFIDVADLYLAGAVTDYAANKAASAEFAGKCDMVQIVLAAEMYQNRDSRNDARQDYSYIVRSLISQLQYFVEAST